MSVLIFCLIVFVFLMSLDRMMVGMRFARKIPHKSKCIYPDWGIASKWERLLQTVNLFLVDVLIAVLDAALNGLTLIKRWVENMFQVLKDKCIYPDWGIASKWERLLQTVSLLLVDVLIVFLDAGLNGLTLIKRWAAETFQAMADLFFITFFYAGVYLLRRVFPYVRGQWKMMKTHVEARFSIVRERAVCFIWKWTVSIKECLVVPFHILKGVRNENRV